MQQHAALLHHWLDGIGHKAHRFDPLDQGPWQPILEGSAGEAALVAARAIAVALTAPSRGVATPSASLAGGDAGEALFFAYLAQAFPGEGHEEVALERLERAIAALAEDTAGPSLCSGFAGVAWATAHLQRLLGLEASSGDPNEEIDQALEEVLDPSAAPLPSELLYGLAGVKSRFMCRSEESCVGFGRGSSSPVKSRFMCRSEESCVGFGRGVRAHGLVQ